MDKVWSAVLALVQSHVLILNGDAVRAVRILAVFACPSIERHPDVYRHALQPLMGEARGIITESVKERVKRLFGAWWRRQGFDLAA